MYIYIYIYTYVSLFGPWPWPLCLHALVLDSRVQDKLLNRQQLEHHNNTDR